MTVNLCSAQRKSFWSTLFSSSESLTLFISARATHFIRRDFMWQKLTVHQRSLRICEIYFLTGLMFKCHEKPAGAQEMSCANFWSLLALCFLFSCLCLVDLLYIYNLPVLFLVWEKVARIYWSRIHESEFNTFWVLGVSFHTAMWNLTGKGWRVHRLFGGSWRTYLI